MKSNLLITIFCVGIIASMVIITACLEKDVIEDVVGPTVETTPEPVEPTPDPPPVEPDISTEVTPPDEDTTPEMTPVEPEMTVEMDPDPITPVETEPEPTMVETTQEPDPLPDGEGLAIGATAPEFSLPDADGTIHSLSNYAGQKVVLVFYATST